MQSSPYAYATRPARTIEWWLWYGCHGILLGAHLCLLQCQRNLSSAQLTVVSHTITPYLIPASFVGAREKRTATSESSCRLFSCHHLTPKVKQTPCSIDAAAYWYTLESMQPACPFAPRNSLQRTSLLLLYCTSSQNMRRPATKDMQRSTMTLEIAFQRVCQTVVLPSPSSPQNGAAILLRSVHELCNARTSATSVDVDSAEWRSHRLHHFPAQVIPWSSAPCFGNIYNSVPCSANVHWNPVERIVDQ